LKLDFALEYSLGHVTHAQNLMAALDGLTEYEPRYLKIPYDDTPLPAAWKTLKLVRENWSVRASLAARIGMRGWRDARAALFHTQVTSLFSIDYMRRVPSIVSLDATPLQYDRLGAYYGHHVGSGISEQLKKRINQRAFSAARQIVTWSEWAKGSLVEEYGVCADKVTVIPPGIDLKHWSFERSTKAKGPVRALFVGGDFDRKGGPILLAALQLARKQGADIALDVVTRTQGVGANEEFVTVHNNVAPNSEQARMLFAASDMFVFPTMGDCLPLAILEALAAGLPVVTTAVGALSEAVADNIEGRVVAPGSVQELAGAMAEIAGDSTLRKRMSEQARAKASDCFNAERNYGRLIALMSTMAQEANI